MQTQAFLNLLTQSSPLSPGWRSCGSPCASLTTPWRSRWELFSPHHQICPIWQLPYCKHFIFLIVFFLPLLVSARLHPIPGGAGRPRPVCKQRQEDHGQVSEDGSFKATHTGSTPTPRPGLYTHTSSPCILTGPCSCHSSTCPSRTGTSACPGEKCRSSTPAACWSSTGWRAAWGEFKETRLTGLTGPTGCGRGASERAIVEAETLLSGKRNTDI